MTSAFRETPYLSWLGIFVVADALVFGPFWVIVVLLSLSMQSWKLFFLCVSVFWLVRSLGETMYWIQEQFATNHRNDPKKLLGYGLVRNESIWFLYQIFWQCVTIFSLLSTLYCIWLMVGLGPIIW